MMKNLELVIPLRAYSLNQGYGLENTWPEMLPVYQSYGLKGHNGLDLYANTGTPVYAAHNGTVTYCGLDGANGYIVVLKTLEPFNYGNDSAYFKTLYGHLLLPLPVYVGKKVNCGDLIAYADNTGASSGAHLHFGLKPIRQGEQDWVWWNVEQDNGYNGAIDPTPYISRKPDGTFYTAKDIWALKEIIRDLQYRIAEYLKGRN